MIGVHLIMLPGVEGKDNIGPALANDAGQFAAHGDVRLDFSVVVAQERDFGHAQRFGGGQLFCFAQRGELFRRHLRVVAAPVAAGGKHIFYTRPGGGINGDGAGADKINIIGVRHNDHHTLRRGWWLIAGHRAA